MIGEKVAPGKIFPNDPFRGLIILLEKKHRFSGTDLDPIPADAYIPLMIRKALDDPPERKRGGGNAAELARP
jgi:hypothetical protein